MHPWKLQSTNHNKNWIIPMKFFKFLKAAIKVITVVLNVFISIRDTLEAAHG